MCGTEGKRFPDPEQGLNPRLYGGPKSVGFQLMFLYIIKHFIIVILMYCNRKGKHIITRDELDQSVSDSGLGHCTR